MQANPATPKHGTGSKPRPPRSWPATPATSGPGFRRRAARDSYRTKEREGAGGCTSYLENKKDYLNCPVFLAAGSPVASGLIEGAARWLIKDRMQVTGATWGLDVAWTAPQPSSNYEPWPATAISMTTSPSTSVKKSGATMTAATTVPKPPQHDHPAVIKPANRIRLAIIPS